MVYIFLVRQETSSFKKDAETEIPEIDRLNVQINEKHPAHNECIVVRGCTKFENLDDCPIARTAGMRFYCREHEIYYDRKNLKTPLREGE